MKRVYKRIISVVLALTVAVGSVCWRPPEAKAVFVSPAVALGASLLASVVVGTTATFFVSSGAADAIGTAIDGLVREFVSTTADLAGYTSDMFFEEIPNGLVVLQDGAIQLSAAAGNLTARFINWLQSYKLPEGGKSISSSSYILELTNGAYSVPYYDKTYMYGNTLNAIGIEPTVFFKFGEVYSYPDGYMWKFTFSNGVIRSYASQNGGVSWDQLNGDVNVGTNTVLGDYFTVCKFYYHDGSGAGGSKALALCYSEDGGSVWKVSRHYVPVAFRFTTEHTFDVKPHSSLQTIPQEIPDNSYLSVNPGIQSLDLTDPQAAADDIMDAIYAGTLAPTVSIEAQATDVPGTDTDEEDDVIAVPGADADLLDWTKYIGQKVAAIPQAIAESVAATFVPSPDFFPTAISNLRDAYSDRMGLLTYPISVLFDFLDRILNLNNQQPILRWDNIYLPGYSGRPVVAAGQYNLNDTLSTSAGRQVHEIYLVVVDAIMILAFLDLCRRKYQKIIRN